MASSASLLKIRVGAIHCMWFVARGYYLSGRELGAPFLP